MVFVTVESIRIDPDDGVPANDDECGRATQTIIPVRFHQTEFRKFVADWLVEASEGKNTGWLALLGIRKTDMNGDLFPSAVRPEASLNDFVPIRKLHIGRDQIALFEEMHDTFVVFVAMNAKIKIESRKALRFKIICHARSGPIMMISSPHIVSP
jgi:hypothetical protein